MWPAFDEADEEDEDEEEGGGEEGDVDDEGDHPEEEQEGASSDHEGEEHVGNREPDEGKSNQEEMKVSSLHFFAVNRYFRLRQCLLNLELRKILLLLWNNHALPFTSFSFSL